MKPSTGLRDTALPQYPAIYPDLEKMASGASSARGNFWSVRKSAIPNQDNSKVNFSTPLILESPDWGNSPSLDFPDYALLLDYRKTLNLFYPKVLQLFNFNDDKKSNACIVAICGNLIPA